MRSMTERNMLCTEVVGSAMDTRAKRGAYLVGVRGALKYYFLVGQV